MLGRSLSLVDELPVRIWRQASPRLVVEKQKERCKTLHWKDHQYLMYEYMLLSLLFSTQPSTVDDLFTNYEDTKNNHCRLYNSIVMLHKKKHKMDNYGMITMI